MIIDLIILGTIAGVAVGIGIGAFTAKNSKSASRMAKLQRKIETGKIKSDSPKARSRVAKHFLKQFHGMTFGVRDLQTRVNSFKIKSKVNDDTDFQPIWKLDSFRGKENKPLKKLYKYKTKEAYKKLKGRRLCLVCTIAQTIRRHQTKDLKDVMAIKGFMKPAINDAKAGGNYLLRIAESRDGSKPYHSCRYQMASGIVKYQEQGKEKQFQPCKIFGKIINRNIKKHGSKWLDFSRFSIDYPVGKSETVFAPDRFVLGCANTENVMYQASKLLMIASSCAKLNENPEIDKIRMIDGPEGKEKIVIMSREDFKSYVNDYSKSDVAKKAIEEINEIDSNSKRFVEDQLNEFAGEKSSDAAPER